MTVHVLFCVRFKISSPLLNFARQEVFHQHIISKRYFTFRGANKNTSISENANEYKNGKRTGYMCCALQRGTQFAQQLSRGKKTSVLIQLTSCLQPFSIIILSVKAWATSGQITVIDKYVC